MPETVSFDKEERIIRVRSYGVVLLEEIYASVSEAQRISGVTGVTRVLVDGREQVATPSVGEIFDQVSQLPRMFRFAFLTNPDTPTIDSVRFAETVGINRGLFLRSFESEAEALAWLRDGAD